MRRGGVSWGRRLSLKGQQGYVCPTRPNISPANNQPTILRQPTQNAHRSSASVDRLSRWVLCVKRIAGNALRRKQDRNAGRGVPGRTNDLFCSIFHNTV